MNPRIAAVTAHDDHTLLITFANDEIRHFNITPYLSYPAFEQLRQVSFFKLAKADHGTVVWPREIDFDPDTLYLEGSPVKLEASGVTYNDRQMKPAHPTPTKINN